MKKIKKLIVILGTTTVFSLSICQCSEKQKYKKSTKNF